MAQTLGHGSHRVSLAMSIANLELRLNAKIRQFEDLVAGLRLEASLLKDLGQQTIGTSEAAAEKAFGASEENLGALLSDSSEIDGQSNDTSDIETPISKRSVSYHRRGASRASLARNRTQTWPLDVEQQDSEDPVVAKMVSNTLPELPLSIVDPRASTISSSSHSQTRLPPISSPLRFSRELSISPAPSAMGQRHVQAIRSSPAASLRTVPGKRNVRGAGRYSGLIGSMSRAMTGARFRRSSAMSMDSVVSALPNLMTQLTGQNSSNASQASRKLAAANGGLPTFLQDHVSTSDQEELFSPSASSTRARLASVASVTSGQETPQSDAISPLNGQKKSASFGSKEEESPARDSSHSNVSHASEARSTITSEHCIELAQFWLEMKRLTRKRRVDAKRISTSASRSMIYSESLSSDFKDPQDSHETAPYVTSTSSNVEAQWRCTRFLSLYIMMAPNAPVAVFWDLLGMIFITYDFIYMPLEAFSLPESTFSITAEWVVMLFWTLTIPRTLLVGYMQEDGEIVLDPVKVMRRYVARWFLVDLIIVGCDWAGVILRGADSLGMVRITKIVRFIRIMRIVRVARMLKVPALAEQLVERFHSEKALLVLGISVYSFMFVGFVHILACLWYLLGKEVSDEGNGTWISYYGLDVAELSYKYATSLHWAATQFIGTMEVNPQNNSERIFAAIVCMLSFIISTAFVSLLTSKITRLQMISESWETQFSMLRRYCQHHRIPSMLTMRVMRSARHVLRMQQRHVLEKDIELLGVISEPLQMELRSKIFGGLMCRNPFFEELNSICFRTMVRLCHFATNVLPVQSGDVLFQAGETPKESRMFFIMSGKLTYSWCGASWPAQHGEYVCEAALWTSWVHTGDMIAAKDSNVLEIKVDVFRQQMSSTWNDVKFFTAMYAEAFVRAMNQTKDLMELNQQIDTITLAREARTLMNGRAGTM